MNLLFDTNVFIPLEPGTLADEEPGSDAARHLFQLAVQTGTQIYLHPAQRKDIEQDKQIDRRKLRLSLFEKYLSLPKPPAVTEPFLASIGNPEPESNHWIDANLIAALHRDAVSILVTEDKGIHSRCGKLNLGDRCRTVAQTIEILRDELPIESGGLPAVRSLLAHELNEQDPIFDSFREDYPDFDTWLSKCKQEHRQCWVVELAGRTDYAGVCIVNRQDRAWEDASDPTLKICTFKIANDVLGMKLGDLLLHAVFEFSKVNSFQTLFIETYRKQTRLIYLLEIYGFGFHKEKTDKSGEIEFRKKMKPTGEDTKLTPLDFHRMYGPYQVSLEHSRLFVIPIEPRFHRMLFPNLEAQGDLFAGQESYGNTLRKAYLCNASTNQVRQGDAVLFYRSQKRQGITAIGIVEDVIKTSDAVELGKFARRRTVYPDSDIEKMTEGRKALGLIFRYAPILQDRIPLQTLTDAGLLKSHPQSIVQLKEDANLWLRNVLNLK